MADLCQLSSNLSNCVSCIQAHCNWCSGSAGAGTNQTTSSGGYCFDSVKGIPCSVTWFSAECPAIQDKYDINVVAAVLSIVFGLLCVVLSFCALIKAISKRRSSKVGAAQIVYEPLEEKPIERKIEITPADAGSSKITVEKRQKDVETPQGKETGVELAPIKNPPQDDSSPRRVSWHDSPGQPQKPETFT